MLVSKNSFSEEVDFTKQIAPLLYKKCHSCHNEKRSKGGYRVDQLGLINEPGESNLWPIVKGQPDESNLWRLVNHQSKPERMPLDSDPLNQIEKKLIENWIKEGGSIGKHAPETHLSSILPRPKYPKPPHHYKSPYPATSTAFSPDNRFLATGGIHEILIFKLVNRTISLSKRIPNLPERIYKILWQDSSELLVAGGNPGRTGEVCRVSLKNDNPSLIIPIASGKDSFFDIVFLDNNKKIAAIGADGKILIINLNSFEVKKVLMAHSDWGFDLGFADINNQYHLFSCGRDKSIRSYNLNTSKLDINLTGFKAPIRSLEIHPNSHFGICLMLEKNSLITWDIKKEKIGKALTIEGADPSSIMKLKETLIVGDSSGKLIKLNKTWNKTVLSKKLGQEKIISISASNNHKTLAISFGSGKISLNNADNFEPILSFLNLPTTQ